MLFCALLTCSWSLVSLLASDPEGRSILVGNFTRQGAELTRFNCEKAVKPEVLIARAEHEELLYIEYCLDGSCIVYAISMQ